MISKRTHIPKDVNRFGLNFGGEITKLRMHIKMCINAYFYVHGVIMSSSTLILQPSPRLIYLRICHTKKQMQ